MKAILAHSAYVRADLDVNWIVSNKLRGTRLLPEHLKPQTPFVRLDTRFTPC